MDAALRTSTKLISKGQHVSAVERLVTWRDTLAEQEAASGAEMFMGLPDKWYEPPTFACENGHISKRYLKSETSGDVCLACGKRVYLVPRITEEELAKVLAK